MKWFDHLFLLGLGAFLILSGCVSTGSNGNGSVVVPVAPPVVVNGGSSTITKIQELIIDIREYTEKGCSFIPTESFLTNMLSRVSYIGDALEYGRAICAAALEPLPQRAATARRFKTNVVVTLPTSINGVPIRGTFVR